MNYEYFRESEGDITVIGPTASGKTKLAIHLSRKLGLPIVNCDTRQFWKRIQKISCSPTLDERSQAPHLLFNVLEDDEKPSLGYWMKEIIPMGRKIIVGGSLFYPYCLMQGIPQVEISENTRKLALEIENPAQYLESVGITVDTHDSYRVKRMLDFYLETGGTFGEFSTKFKRESQIISISTEQVELQDNILARIQKNLEEWIEECWQNQHSNFFSIIGYKECIEYRRGNLSKDNLISSIYLKTNQYSKRQVKFMRRFKADSVVSMAEVRDLE
jgi:tRNA dimethylallyltransferase